jgi:hypothetical protein
MGEPDVETQIPETHAYDDLDRLTQTTIGRMLWWMRVTTPIFILLGYLLENTIYRNVQLKKFDSTEDHSEH